MNTTRARKGFTLTELVVTIIILGLLAAVSALAYGGILGDSEANIDEVEADMTARRDAAESQLAAEGPLSLNQGSGGLVDLTGRTFAGTFAGGASAWSPETKTLLLDVQGVPNTYAFYDSSIFGSPYGCFVMGSTAENKPVEYSSDPTVPGSSVTATHCPW